MRNVHIAGLDGFIVNQATLNLDSLRYSFDYTVPNVVANFWYDLTGEVFSLIPIFGTGNARMEPISNLANLFACNQFLIKIFFRFIDKRLR